VILVCNPKIFLWISVIGYSVVKWNPRNSPWVMALMANREAKWDLELEMLWIGLMCH
jgi:hypothetical protein